MAKFGVQQYFSLGIYWSKVYTSHSISNQIVLSTMLSPNFITLTLQECVHEVKALAASSFLFSRKPYILIMKLHTLQHMVGLFFTNIETSLLFEKSEI
jgi:hypothetical protein